MNSFFERRYIIQGIFILLSICLLAKLFYIQIIDDRYLLSANTNAIRKIISFPARGPILDRNNKILVQNEANFDIWVTPKEVKPFDTVKFCQLIGIDKADFDKRWKKAVTYSRILSSPFERQLPVQLYSVFEEHSFEFPGFYVQPRSVRYYPDSIAAQFLGYIDEVTDKDIERYHGYYSKGDYIGRSGVEKAYEDTLRGQRGVQRLYVDSKGVTRGHYLNGMYDTSAVPGAQLISSLDKRIQKLGEKLMKNKVGSIVAIEPATGEILCFVSSPTYDPNELVGRDKGNNAAALNQNPYKPFFIRPIQAYYPPGSSFKPLSALIALQEGIITPQTTYNCPGYYVVGNRRIKCTHVHGVVNLSGAVAGSCNGYFSMVFQKLLNAHGERNSETTYGSWRDRVTKFGLGSRLGLDMGGEGKGNLPAPGYYNRVYKAGGWQSGTIISLAIGQGELEATPLQLANIECTIANHGYFYKPHLIKGIGDRKVIRPEYTSKNYVGIDSLYFEPVIDGMQAVVERGTAIQSQIPGIVMCGKTGTAQNPHGENHSVFVAFAPRKNPKIAIAVVVENSGEGAHWAAPIASFIVEKYLRDTISKRPSGITPEQFMNANKLPALLNYQNNSKPAPVRKVKAQSINSSGANKSNTQGVKAGGNQSAASQSSKLKEHV